MNPCLHCAGSGFVRVMPQACSPHVMPQACSPHVMPQACSPHVMPQACSPHVMPQACSPHVMPQACSPHVMPQACSPHDDGGLDACPRCARVAEAEFAFAALTARPTPQPRRPQGRQPRPHTSHRERTAA